MNSMADADSRLRGLRRPKQTLAVDRYKVNDGPAAPMREGIRVDPPRLKQGGKMPQAHRIL